MSINETRLRGKRSRLQNSWPLGSLPRKVIVALGRQLVHRMAIGHGDITGDDFGTIFAEAIEGDHLSSPLGVADVVLDNNAWSVKTIKLKSPFTEKRIRLISGRNSVDYSHGIENPHMDIQATGKAILSIWNARVNEALGEYDDLRIAVLVRNFDTRQFIIFEETATRYASDDFVWKKGETKNKKEKHQNLHGYSKATGEHYFTWQFHGAQFTIKRNIPGSAIKFIINHNVPIIDVDRILRLSRFDESWVEIIV